MRVEPSGAHAHDDTHLVWPVRVRRQLQSTALHTLAVQSREVVTRAEPSGAHAHASTWAVWPEHFPTTRMASCSILNGPRLRNASTASRHSLSTHPSATTPPRAANQHEPPLSAVSFSVGIRPRGTGPTALALGAAVPRACAVLPSLPPPPIYTP